MPRANVLVTGNAFGRLIRIYNRNRLSGVGQALGMATASYEEALEYSKVRRQFGRELADFQGLQWMLADMAIQLNAARAVLYRAAEENEERELDPLQVSMAKVFIAETCTRVCDMAIQLFGGYGYMEESPGQLALPGGARHRDLRRHHADPPQHDRRPHPRPPQRPAPPPCHPRSLMSTSAGSS